MIRSQSRGRATDRPRHGRARNWIALGAPLAASGVGDGLLARLAQDAWIMPRRGAFAASPGRLTILLPPSCAADAIGLARRTGVERT